ncbi:MAG: autotransporter outer membrane beta-barrel domain-containing protein, partial [Planctomycetia bacterium]|nr:autotransporter outer membrane beta-barrel domain-containing protein [Planctomycetia bacterium]
MEINYKIHYIARILFGKTGVSFAAGLLSLAFFNAPANAIGPTIGDLIAENAITYNEHGLGNSLKDLSHLTPAQRGEGISTILDQLERINAVPDGISEDVYSTMSLLDGSFYGSLAMVNSMNHTVLNQQISNQLRPKNYCNCFSDTCECCSPTKNLWAKYYNISGEFDPDGNAYGVDYDVNTVLIGGDRKLDSGDRLGGYFGYSGGSTKTFDRLEEADNNDYIFGLYFLRTTESGYFLANTSWGFNDYKSDRDLPLYDYSECNQGSANSNEFDLRFEKGWDFRIDSTKLEPFFGLQYLYSSYDSFDEEGNGATPLNVQIEDGNSLQSELGARLIWADKPDRTRKTSLYVQGSWIHEYLDQCREISGRFRSAPASSANYTVRGLDPGSDFCNVGFGATGQWNRLTLFGSYDFLMNDLVFLPVGSF